MSNTTTLSVLAVLTVALAGCVGQAPGATPPSTIAASPQAQANLEQTRASPAFAAGSPSSSEALPLALYLTPAGALMMEPPAEAGTVTMEEPVTGPFTEATPTWTGQLDRAMIVLEGGVPLVFHVSASTASAEVKTVPVFAAFGEIPGFFFSLRTDDLRWSGQTDGPAVVRTGEIVEVRGTLEPAEDKDDSSASGPVVLPAGTILSLRIFPLYTHVQAAAEFQFVFDAGHVSSVGSKAPA